MEKYTEITQNEKHKTTPKEITINTILNFSKSIEVQTTKKPKITVFVHLN